MYYSEWIWNFEVAIIGFLIHEQPLTYGSDWGRYSGFYLSLGSIHVNKKVRSKTRILKTTGGCYVDCIDHRFYTEYIKFITYNQKLTPEEEKIVKAGIKSGKICIGGQQ